MKSVKAQGATLWKGLSILLVPLLFSATQYCTKSSQNIGNMKEINVPLMAQKNTDSLFLYDLWHQNRKHEESSFTLIQTIAPAM